MVRFHQESILVSVHFLLLYGYTPLVRSIISNKFLTQKIQSLLTRSLTEISKNVIKSPQGSTYFCINKIKVRVSDHMSDSTDGDLAIIPALRGYVVFPLRSVNRKQITVLPNVTAVINYVKQYAYF